MTLDGQADDLARLCQQAARASATGDAAGAAEFGERAREGFDRLWQHLRSNSAGRLVASHRASLQRVGLSEDEALGLLGEHLFRRLERFDARLGAFEPWWGRVAARFLIDLGRVREWTATSIDAVAEPTSPVDPLEVTAIDALERERLGNIWERFDLCQRALLAESRDCEQTQRSLLAFLWVEIEGASNRFAAQALGVSEVQCTRNRAWVRRELPRMFRRLFPDLADDYDL